MNIKTFTNEDLQYAEIPNIRILGQSLYVCVNYIDNSTVSVDDVIKEISNVLFELSEKHLYNSKEMSSQEVSAILDEEITEEDYQYTEKGYDPNSK